MSRIEDILDLVSTPGRYLPLELGAVKKDLAKAGLKVALAFPDLYEVGMSHLGIRILYHLMNDRDWIACERVFAPWTDMERIMRDRGIPLSSMESGVPLREFDILGFSLTYELGYTNVLNMMDLSGIPLYASERAGGEWPVVIGGGPCASNPEPVAPFFDAFLFGDAEEAVLEIGEAVASWKGSGAEKQALFDALAEIEGVYVPSLFEPVYNEDGTIKNIEPKKKGYDKVRRRIVADLDKAYFPRRSMSPLIEPVHDRVMVEVARGCSRGCRFCHAGIVYRPVRERSPANAAELARQGLKSTGYEECSLLSLSVGDYSCITGLLVSMIKEHYPERVSVSLPSLRVQGLSDQMLDAISSVRKTGFTIAPEAGTERLRRVINKDYREEELIETAQRVFARGWRNLKLYFMVGLPTETGEDVQGILEVSERIARIKGSQGRPRVTLNLSGFVPKPHTPFQWEPQAGPEYLFRVQEKIKKAFHGKNKKVKWHKPEITWLEGVMSRGDRRLAPVLARAFREGARFDGWTEKFDHGLWKRAFEQEGLDPQFYTRERGGDELFPWEHLDSRAWKEWLWQERERAHREELSEDCREAGCERPCGVCDHRSLLNRTYGKEEPGGPLAPGAGGSKGPSARPDIFFRFRLRYARRGPIRFMGQLEVVRLFARAVRRAGLPMRYTQGFHQKPRIVFGPSPPVGVESEAEYVEMELLRRMAPEELKERLGNVMPDGIEMIESVEVRPGAPAISSLISSFDYEVTPPESARFDPRAAASFLEKETMVITQKREKGDREVDLRSRVKKLSVGDDGVLFMTLKVMEGPGVKPHEVLAEVFGLSREQTAGARIVRTRARIKEASPARYPGKSERARKARSGR